MPTRLLSKQIIIDLEQLNALWRMFMLEVADNKRTCRYCRSLFEPTRRDNVYCSNNCKRMAYYYKQQRRSNSRQGKEKSENG
jgi:hypothetical protein